MHIHLLIFYTSLTASWFGVLSARVVRYCRRYHADDGHRLFVTSPARPPRASLSSLMRTFSTPKVSLLLSNRVSLMTCS